MPMLLCDFHIHTNLSDGSMELEEVVDLYGQSGFDVIAITDHVVDTDNALGKIAVKLSLSITEKTFECYLDRIREQTARAWAKYRMLVIPGVEISKNCVSAGKSAHLLILDIREFIPASSEYEEIFTAARRQSALVVACHPHHTSNKKSKDTLFLWNHRRKYAPFVDAWEIANRDDVFNVISLKKYPYIANSDFHKHRHIFSWKTLLDCDKDVESVKQCIRVNRGVSITLFRK